MPKIDLACYVLIVAAVFSISSVTAFVFAMLRVLNPDLFYLEGLMGKNRVIHYLISALMLATSAVGVLNSAVVMKRSAAQNSGRNITIWLLLVSLFEISRVVYLLIAKTKLEAKGTLQVYELVVSVTQYLLDTFLCCQMILRN